MKSHALQHLCVFLLVIIQSLARSVNRHADLHIPGDLFKLLGQILLAVTSYRNLGDDIHNREDSRE